MPHSSGGGSSSGGFHSSSSSSSSGSRHRVSRNYFRGSHPYYRYDLNRHRPVIFYSSTSGSLRIVENLLWGLMVLFALVMGIRLIVYSLTPPAKITSDYYPVYTINDDADSFTEAEETEIGKELTEFYEQTGIPTEIHTITESTFIAANKDDLETYAYYDYVNRFDDEDHWLIVFEDAGDQKTWRFEGMQGDNTDPQLTDTKADAFNEELTENLWKEDQSYGQAFVDAFRKLNTMASPKVDSQGIILGIGILLFGALFSIPLFTGQNRKLARTKPARKNQINVKGRPKLVKCEYCGGTYVYGETKCPYCNAPGKIDDLNGSSETQ